MLGDTASTKAKLKFADPLTMDEVSYKNPNVYIECSALLTGNLDQMPKEKVDTYDNAVRVFKFPDKQSKH